MYKLTLQFIFNNSIKSSFTLSLLNQEKILMQNLRSLDFIKTKIFFYIKTVHEESSPKKR